ncbi:MAG: hypothetical protein AAGG75_13310 [Bacteroidota bacterium]
MALTKVEMPGDKEIQNCQNIIKELKSYQSKNWGIGLNGSTFQPDGFLTFFTQRNLPFSYYVVNKGVTIGSSKAYDANIQTLETYMAGIRKSETDAGNAIIKSLKSYQSNFWAIGLNGDTLQPDGFNTNFAERQLPFKPFVRSTSGVSIGEQSAYDENISTMQNYIKALG